MPPKVFTSKLIHKKELNSGIFLFQVEAPFLAQHASPGQFVMVLVSKTTDPLLRRPFSICGVKNDIVEVLFQVAGKGTAIMSEWLPNHNINLMGPLGNGFNVPEGLDTAFLIAGGIGIAPLLFLIKKMNSINENVKIKFFVGGKSDKDFVLLENYDLQSCELFFSTEDGSRGFRGVVTDLFLDCIGSELPSANENICLFGCGPTPMSRKIAESAHKYNLTCQLSLESRMACGTGACLGCVVETKKNPNSDISYSRVCMEGPVFNSREIVW